MSLSISELSWGHPVPGASWRQPVTLRDKPPRLVSLCC